MAENQDKAKRRTTIAGECAKAIRTELKAAFPKISFRVLCKNYSGGNSVNIHWIDGPTAAQVMELAGKYKHGQFNGMIDCYEYTNDRDDLPQVDYVFPNRQMSADARAVLSSRHQFEIDDSSCRTLRSFFSETSFE